MAQRLPIHPMRIIKSGVQVLYSVLKAGVDGATQYIGNFRDPKIRYTYDQKVVTDGLFSLVTNTITLQRMLKQMDQTGTDMESFVSIDSFRDKCSRQGNFVDSVLELCVEFVTEAMTNPIRPSPNVIASSSSERTSALPAASQSKRKKRYTMEGFNQLEMKRIRRGERSKHGITLLPNPNERRRRRLKCILCGKNTTYYCLYCSETTQQQVSLCRSPRVFLGGLTCFDYFHNTDVLVSRKNSASV